MPRHFRAVLALPILLVSAPAFAQDSGTEAQPPAGGVAPDEMAPQGDMVTIGAGVAVVPSYEGSKHYIVTGIPGARGTVKGINFTLRGNRFSADVIPSGNKPGWDLQAGPVISVNFDRTGRIDQAQVEALGKHKVALELGGYVGIGYQGLITSDYDKLNISISYVHDVTGIHDSYVLTPSIDYGTPLSRRSYVGVSLSADYAGNGYADTYFTITPAGAAASGLPAFAARGGWKDWTATLLGSRSLTGDLTHGLALVGAGGYRRLLNDFSASPVVSDVGSPDQWIGTLGLAYTF